MDFKKTSLGIEFGSTRIKAVLIDEQSNPIASGSYTWENRFENGVWTYSLDDIFTGLKTCYKELKKDVADKFGVTLSEVGSMGISAMMHGYVALDENNELLVPFRTWRNTITAESSAILTRELGFNIPQRWSVSHLYQAILNKEEHLPRLKRLSTLAVYIHLLLTGEFVAGVGEASGMFPIDSNTNNYDTEMMAKFDWLATEKGYDFDMRTLFPKVLVAGDNAGSLTEAGAKLLDPDGDLKAGIPLCPPEGDAGTGMVATNSIKVRTGNVSAGTSIFSMVVLEKALSRVYTQIDMVTTPAGKPVAMVHCNNCTGDIDAWVKIFGEVLGEAGADIPKSKLYDLLYFKALEGDKDCGGVVSFNYISGEPVSDLTEGRPLMLRTPDAKFNLANFMRNELYSAFAALKNGNDLLFKNEGVSLESISGHGGIYKTEGVGAKITAAALNTKVTVMKTAGEGGPWGMAILAAYMLNKCEGETLDSYLENRVFANAESATVEPDEADVKGFEEYMKLYNKALAVEKAATENV
ncbi:MAG: FGGY-family carbohydrate kinase [Clostridiaceae bacterium]|nr:FGGY-family carbohydrate kinase [Clostridiaceae bacterium]